MQTNFPNAFLNSSPRTAVGTNKKETEIQASVIIPRANVPLVYSLTN